MILLFKIFAIALTIIVLLVIGFAIALINASKKQTQKNELEDKIRQAISTARRVRFKAESDIRRLKMWAADAISLTYGQMVTGLEPEQLLSQYDQIKQKYTQQVDPAQAEKTEKIVNGYLSQIAIKQSEIQAARQVEDKYTQLLEQLKQAKLNQKKMDTLERHAQRLEQLNNQTQGQKQILEQVYSYDMIKNDVEQKLATLEALQQLQEKYDPHTFTQNATVYQQEMNKILQNISE